MLFTLYFLKDLILLVMYASPLLAFFVSIIIFLGQRIGRREGWARLDALYYSFITATTVGYGDFRPKSPRSKFQAVMIAFSGLIMTGIMVTLAVEAANTAFKDSGIYEDFREHKATIQDSRQVRRRAIDLSVVAYLPDYRISKWSPEGIGSVTDLIYFGARLTPEGQWAEPKITASASEKLQAVRRAENCRVILCIGGGNRSEGFAAMATDSTRRKLFLQALLEYSLEHGFDGVDYDWEFPSGKAEKKSYVDLIVETKQQFAPLGLLVTVAQSPGPGPRSASLPGARSRPPDVLQPRLPSGHAGQVEAGRPGGLSIKVARLQRLRLESRSTVETKRTKRGPMQSSWLNKSRVQTSNRFSRPMR